MRDEDRQTREAFDSVTGEAMALTPPRVEDQEAGRTIRNTLTIESVPGFDRPMSASPDDIVVAQDELTGQLIYETALGERYTISLNPDQRTARTRFEEDTLPAMRGYFENPTLPTVSQAAGFVGDVAQGAYETLEGAVQGRGTIGDVTGLAVSSGAGSMFGEVPEGALRIFGGFNAATNPGVDASGRPLPRSVGADGLPRFEIDDSVAIYKPQNLVEHDFSNTNLSMINWDVVNAHPGQFFPTLDQAIDHPELFRQYPELAKINIVVDTSLPEREKGYYSPSMNLIAVSRDTASDFDSFAETLLHEIQHDVQVKEGFDVGTSPDSDVVARKQASEISQNPEAEEDIRYIGYYGKSGEVESRNTGDRRFLTLEERFGTPPTRTESVSRGRQWLVDESGNIRDAINLFGTDDKNRGGFLRRLGDFLRGRRGSQYNAGGVVSMEEQMSLFDMGGLTDDGAMRDPVSGNEVPPGSMASEVRDDVPAMLSEGEYIVPADVVRYYGVKFFEDLRSQAKSGLMDMERNGRIGGEPVPGPGPSMEEGELTPEEMAMLAEITGMAQGGMVRKGYQAGGLETGMTQQDFMDQGQQAAGFQLPRSIFTPSAPTTQQAPFTPVMMYGPQGMTVLATSQAQYNQLLGQGYTTEPQVATTAETPEDSGGDNLGIETPEVTTGGGFSLSEENLEALSSDPLSFGAEALGAELPFGAETRQIAQVGGFLGGIPGIAIGGLAGAAFELDNVAKARAALEVAKSQDLAGTPEYAALQNSVETAVANLSGPARFLDRLGLGSGTNYAASVTGVTPTTTTGARATAGGDDGSGTPLAPTTSPRPPQRPDRGGSSSSSAEDIRRQAVESARRGSEEVISAAERNLATEQELDTMREEARKAEEQLADIKSNTKTTGRVGFEKGGLVSKPTRKKPVAKKK